MTSFSQNNEDLKVQEYFGNYKGTLLSIGENSGTFLSNALLLIRDGWKATLVEPAPKAFEQLKELHKDNPSVHCINAAIGNENTIVAFYDSSTHLGKGDTSLLSTASKKDYDKWKGSTEFEKIKVSMITFDKMMEESPYKTFEFISIDCEGYDLPILRQMNLMELGVRVICIEHNGDNAALSEIRSICSSYGLNTELLINAENIILAK